MATVTRPDRLWYTGDDEANALLAQDPFALLIGFALDQQVTVQKAFSAPLDLKRRLGGTLDAREIAKMDPAELERIFAQKPALHRFPAAMARRVHELAATVVDEYGGDPDRLWREASDGRDLEARLAALPGFGGMKVRMGLAVLSKRFGVDLPGLAELVPQHPTLGDVDSAEALERYQEAKRAYKAKLRAQKS